MVLDDTGWRDKMFSGFKKKPLTGQKCKSFKCFYLQIGNSTGIT